MVDISQYMALYVIINVFCVLLVTVFGIHSRVGLGNQRAQTIFKLSIVNLIIFFITDTVWFLMDRAFVPQNLVISYILKIIYFASGGVNGFVWFLFFETISDSVFSKTKKAIVYSSILFWIIVVLLIINIPTGIIFKVDPETFEYSRGVMFWSIYILIYTYVIVSSIRAIIRAIKTNDYKERTKFIILSTYPVVPGICGILQYFFWRVPVACAGLTFSIIVMYLSSMNEIISEDPLTGLLNRNQFFRKAKRYFYSRSEDEITYLFMIDVDKFKRINDTYGHVEGDRALIITTQAITKVMGTFKAKSIIGRYGGDEFIILINLPNDFDIDTIKDSISKEIDEVNKIDNKEYNITVSVGVSKKESNIKTIKDLVLKADDNLYKIKESKNIEE